MWNVQCVLTVQWNYDGESLSESGLEMEADGMDLSDRRLNPMNKV